MRISLTCPTYWPYVRRGERFVNGLAKYLNSRGHEIKIITSKPGRCNRIIKKEGIIIVYKREYFHPLFSAKLPYYIFSGSCFRTLLHENTDIVQSLFYIDAFSASWSKHFNGIKPIFYVPNCDPFHWGGMLDKFMFRMAIRSSILVAPSRYLQDSLKKDYGLDSLLIYPGVDIEYFRPAKKKYFDQIKVLCMADLLDERKRIPLLIKAFERFKETVPEAVLQLSGRTNSRASRYFINLAKSAIRNSIKILGVGIEKDIPSLYAQATITVLPSKKEPFGMVLVESLASGTPVVATRGGGVPEVIDNPYVGILFNDEGEQTVDSLYKAMLQCLELAKEPETLSRCIAHSKRYDWSVRGPEFEEIYNNMRKNHIK